MSLARMTCLLVALAVSGCATTRMSSQTNPELMGLAFDRVMVHGNFQSLEYRQLAEGYLCERLARVAPLHCLRAVDVFFPGRTYASDDITSRLAEYGVDGVLILQAIGAGTTSVYIPPTTRTTGTAQVRGVTTTGSTVSQTHGTITGTSTTQTYGGYDISKPWANYEAILLSIADSDVAWYATATSSGNAWATWQDLIRSAANETANRLDADGVLSGAIERHRVYFAAPTSQDGRGAALPVRWRSVAGRAEWILSSDEAGVTLVKNLRRREVERGDHVLCEFDGIEAPMQGICREITFRTCRFRRIRCQVESPTRIDVMNSYRIEGMSEAPDPEQIECGSCAAGSFRARTWTLVPSH